MFHGFYKKVLGFMLVFCLATFVTPEGNAGKNKENPEENEGPEKKKSKTEEGTPAPGKMDDSGNTSNSNNPSETQVANPPFDQESDPFHSLLTLAFSGDKIAERSLSIIIKEAHPNYFKEKISLARISNQANNNNPFAQWILGDLYLHGYMKEDGTKAASNPEMAFTYFQELAEKNNHFAQYSLGHWFLFTFTDASNKRIPQNIPKGYEWLEKAAIQGNVLAQVALGSVLQYGMPYDNDVDEDEDDDVSGPEWGLAPAPLIAMKWLEKAADQGYYLAHELLGYMFFEGAQDIDKKKWIIPSNPHKAFNCLYWARESLSHVNSLLSKLQKSSIELDCYRKEFFGIIEPTPPVDLNLFDFSPLEKELSKAIKSISETISGNDAWDVNMKRISEKALSAYLGPLSSSLEGETSLNNEAKDTILNHFASKLARFSRDSTMVTQLDGLASDLVNEKKQKSGLYKKAADCLALLSGEPMLEEIILGSNVFVKITSPQVISHIEKENKLKIFEAGQDLPLENKEDEIHLFKDKQSHVFLTLGNKNVKVVDKFLQEMKTLDEITDHYKTRAAALTDYIRVGKALAYEKKKILKNPDYSLDLQLDKQNSTEKVKNYRELTSELDDILKKKASRAQKKYEDLSAISTSIMVAIEKAQPMKRTLMRKEHDFLPKLGDEK